MRMVKKDKQDALVIIVFLVVIIFSFSALLTVKAVEDQKNVLFISSYSQAFQTVPDQIKGIQSVFGDRYNLDIEYMDMKRLETKENEELFFSRLTYKLSKLASYDAIIVGDDAALVFAMDYQDKLFPEIPIVFFGINDYERGKKAASNPFMTGIYEETSLGENIEIALRFNSDAQRVVGIVDSTLTGIGDQQQLEEVSKAFPDLEFASLNSSDYSFEELGKMLEALGNDTILIYQSMNEDKTSAYMNLSETFFFLKDHTRIPVYRASYGGVGKGLIGGKLIDYEGFGQRSAQLVIDVLNGQPIEQMALIEETPYYYIFDYELIQKYGIDEKLIPAGAELINKPESFLEKYQSIVLPLMAVLGFFVVMIAVLLIDNIKRRRIENELTTSNKKLKETYEVLSATEESLREQYRIIDNQASEVGILNQKYKMATEGTNSVIWELDLVNEELTLSENILEIISDEIKLQENYNVLTDQLISSKSKMTLIKEVENYLNDDIKELNFQIPIKINEDEKKWFLIRGNKIFDENKKNHKMHGLLIDMTKTKEQESYIEYLANYDCLTGLANRMKFTEHLSEALDQKQSGAVLLFDLDNFKSINDTLGHVYGDHLLKEIALRLSSLSSEKTIISRLGGDEFLILRLGSQNYDELIGFVDDVWAVFRRDFVVAGIRNKINISLGISCFPSDSQNTEELLMNADTAMYQIKHKGKNDFVFYDKSMKDEIQYKLEVESILKEALREDGFKLHYQPQVRLKDGEIIGFEALLRLKNYQIYPDVFIKIAEETGLIVEIGRWVAKEAVNQLTSWRKKGLEGKPIAINFSSEQLRDRGFIQYLKELLWENDLETSQIEIEITESILVENNPETLLFLNALKKSGFKIALDDFGTGYSSLNYLTFLPVDKVKLDKSINDKFISDDNMEVMDSLIMLVHSLDLEIIAEGIEDWARFEQLKNSNCDAIQGYLFSRPLPPEEIESFYHQNLVDRYLRRLIN